MKPVVIESKIDGKIVRCVFIFDKYSRKDYRGDFDEFVAAQTKKKLYEGFKEYPLLRIKEFTWIPYEYFCEYAPKLFSKVIFYMIKEHPELVLSDELNIQIIMKRIPEFAYYFETVDKPMNAENACFKGSGLWFLYCIVAPYFYSKKMDSSIVMRYFLHELTHYVDAVKDLALWDVERTYGRQKRTYEGKIKNIIGRKSAYGINYLYNTLFNLREEGLADFVGRRESPEFDIDGSTVREYNSNLKKLAFMRYKKDAYKFYIDKIGFQNLTPIGEYSIGRNMCVIVALSIAKENNIPITIRIGKNRVSGVECYDRLDGYLSKKEKMYISGIPKKIIAETMSIVRPTAHYYFLKLYEKACDKLGISEDNRAMTQKRFYNLVREAKKVSLDQNRILIEKEGFIFIQSDIDLP